MSALDEVHPARPCPVCEEGRLVPFLDAGAVPVHVGALWRSRDAAEHCPRGAMRPGHCARCGLVFNVGFDPRLVDYTCEYDNALHFSAVFQQYEDELASRLIEGYDVRGRQVVEIGCGDGHFLGLLCEKGGNSGLGYDPSHDPSRVDPLARDRVRFVKRYFGHGCEVGDAGLLCMRHVLEHVADPVRLLHTVRTELSASRGAIFYCEVPNGLFALHERSIWDLMYEHSSYFVPATLAYAIERAGFEVLAVDEGYSGQFLSVEARVAAAPTEPALPAPDALAELASDVRSYAAHFESLRARWRDRLRELADRSGRAVVWGAGGKTVQFSCLVGDEAPVEYVVDINPAKQGTFLTGSGWPVRAPDALRAAPPDLVIIANPIYEREIRSALGQLGVQPSVALL